MKNRRETTNGNLKFKGSLEKFNALLYAVELNRHEFLSEKNSSGLEDLIDDQPPRKKRSLRRQPKKMIIDVEVMQNEELVLLGSDVDWVVMVLKQKEMLQSQTQEKSSSGEAVRLRPEIPDLNLPPDEIPNLNLPPSHLGDDDTVIDNCD